MSHHPKSHRKRMRWEIRLGIALLLFVAAILVTTWCLVRLNHYPGNPQHLLYAIATSVAAIATCALGAYALIIVLEKPR